MSTLLCSLNVIPRKYDCILLIFIIFVKHAFTQDCSVSTYAGPDDPASFNTDFDKDKGFGYVVYGELYTIQCCGTVTRWEFSVGDNGDIELQVWRPDGKKDKKYELVGFNTFSVSRIVKKNPGYVTYDVEADSLLKVQKDDLIGWYAPGDSLIEYKDDTEYDGIWKIKHDDNVKIGDTVDFSSGDKQSHRTYGIQATITPNSPPTFDLLLDTSISMNAEVGSTVYTVHVVDTDGDQSELQLEMLTQSEFFAFDPATGVLSVSSEITVPEEGTSIDLNFKVTDRCGAEATGTLTVHIDYVSSRPTFPPRTEPSDPETTTTTTTTTTSTTDITTIQTTPPDEIITEPETTDETPRSKRQRTTTTTSPAPSVTEKDTGNETRSAMDKGNKLDAGLIGGIVAGIVFLIILTVVSVICIANKRGRVKPSKKDPEKGKGEIKQNGKDTSNQNSNGTNIPNKPVLNGKPQPNAKAK